MGQALRRVAGRVRSLTPASPAPPKNVDRPPRVVPFEKDLPKKGGERLSNLEDVPVQNEFSNVLENRDPDYDAMLSKMVGRIKRKPGGKLEMGEARIVEKYTRPLPKLRSTRTVPNQDEQKATAPGTLSVAQLKQILLAHQGKAEDDQGPLDAHQIAEKFKIDTRHIARVLEFVSLPPEDNSKKVNDEENDR